LPSLPPNANYTLHAPRGKLDPSGHHLGDRYPVRAGLFGISGIPAGMMSEHFAGQGRPIVQPRPVGIVSYRAGRGRRLYFPALALTGQQLGHGSSWPVSGQM
jgi:hypothetical protein